MRKKPKFSKLQSRDRKGAVFEYAPLSENQPAKEAPLARARLSNDGEQAAFELSENLLDLRQFLG